jgi:hypothetical protein
MHRVKIVAGFQRQPEWRLWIGVPVIYLPLLTTVPFVFVGVWLARLHLWMIGATGVKGYWDFVPDWISHRYRNADHVSYAGGTGRWNIVRARFFWVFNCKMYCPMSVALLDYAAYLVKVVENWWCPFAHDRKPSYADGAIDGSFWHTNSSESAKLHPDDRDNPIWSEQAGRRSRP